MHSECCPSVECRCKEEMLTFEIFVGLDSVYACEMPALFDFPILDSSPLEQAKVSCLKAYDEVGTVSYVKHNYFNDF